MGFTSWEAQLMSAPPYVSCTLHVQYMRTLANESSRYQVVGAITTIILSKLSDRFYW